MAATRAIAEPLGMQFSGFIPVVRAVRCRTPPTLCRRLRNLHQAARAFRHVYNVDRDGLAQQLQAALDEQVHGELPSGQGNYLLSAANLPGLAQPPLFHAAHQVAQQP